MGVTRQHAKLSSGLAGWGSAVESAVERLRQRGRSAAVYAARLAGAAAAAFAVAKVLLPGSVPVLSALTALLIVEATVVGAVATSAKRVVSVVLGVLIAIGFAMIVGLSWWSLGVLVAVSLLVGQMLRLGNQLLEIPISAMLVMAVGGEHATATDRVVETLIGAAIGVLVNVVVPPPVQSGAAAKEIADFGDRLAALLDRVAGGVSHGFTESGARRWLSDARRLSRSVSEAEDALDDAEESRRLNPRALAHRDTTASLRGELDALEHSAVSVRSALRSVVDTVSEDPHSVAPGREPDALRAATVWMVRDLGSTVQAFSDLVRAEVDGGTEAAEEALRTSLAALEESRFAVVKLSRAAAPSGLLTRSLPEVAIEGVDRILAELDVEGHARRRAQRRLLDHTHPLRVLLTTPAKSRESSSNARSR